MFPAAKMILLMLYSLLLIYVTVRLVLLGLGRNKKKSFQTAFLIMCFIWILFRVVGFAHRLVKDDGLGSTPIGIIAADFLWGFVFGEPFAVHIQWAMFSLLLLFYIRLFCGTSWGLHRRKSAWVYFSLNALFLTFSLIMQVLETVTKLLVVSELRTGHDSYSYYDLGDNATDPGHHHHHHRNSNHHTVNHTHRHNLPPGRQRLEDFKLLNSTQTAVTIYCGFMFMLLSIGMVGFSLVLCRVRESRATHGFKLAQTIVVNCVLAAIFISRTVFNFLDAVELISVFSLNEYYILLLYALWEVAPAIILLLTLAKDKENGPVLSRMWSKSPRTSSPRFGVFYQLSVNDNSVDSSINTQVGLSTLLVPPTHHPNRPMNQNRQGSDSDISV